MRRSRWSLVLLPLVVLTLQVRSQTATIPGGGGTSTATRPDSIQDSGFNGYWTNSSGQGRAGGALLGKVVVVGESFLWEPVPVTVKCNSETVFTTQSDAKGNFGIRTTVVPGGLTLQGDAQRQMETHFENCTVQAAIPGFHSNAVTITHRILRDDPNLGTLTLTRDGGAAGTWLSATSAAAPAKAVKEFEKARNELMDQNTDRAEQHLQKATEFYPGYAEAWYQLGRIQQLSNHDDARVSFGKALVADPKFVPPYEHLAALAAQDQKWRELVDETKRSLSLDPTGTAQIWYYNALGTFELGQVDEAEASAAKSLAMDPLHSVPNTEQLLAVILSSKKDYPGALAHLRNCLTYIPNGSSADLLKKQIAHLEQVVGQTK